MTKRLRKAIMLRSKFRNRFLKEKTEEFKSLYNKQRNICVSLLRKTKINYYEQVENKIVTNNRKFWKVVSPLFSEKALRKESIILKEHGKTITDNKKIAETFNNFFSNIVKKQKFQLLVNYHVFSIPLFKCLPHQFIVNILRNYFLRKFAC